MASVPVNAITAIATDDPMDAVPIDASLLADPGVRDFVVGIVPIVKALEEVPSQLAGVLLDLRPKLAAIKADKGASASAKATHESEARAAALAVIDNSYEQVELLCQELRASVGSVLASAVQSPYELLLHESRVSRAWARAVRLMDSTSGGQSCFAHLTTLYTNAIEADDAAMLQALREELAIYLRSRRLSSIGDAILQQLAESAPSGTTPLVRAARQFSPLAEAGAKRIALAFRQARAEIAGNVGKTEFLPGFKPNQSLLVSEVR